MVEKVYKEILVAQVPETFRAEVSHLAKDGFVSAESLSDYFDATSAPDFYFPSPPDGKINIFDYMARHPIGESSPQRFFQSARWFSQQGLLAKKLIDEPQAENNPRWHQLTNDFQAVAIRDLPPQIRAVAGAVLELWRRGNYSADWRRAPSDFLTPKIVEDILGAKGDDVISQENFRLFIPSSYATISFRDMAAFAAFLRYIKGFKNLPEVDERTLPIQVVSVRLVGTEGFSVSNISNSLFDDARRAGKDAPEAIMERDFLKRCPNMRPLLGEINWLLKYYAPRLQNGTRILLDQRDPTAWARLLFESAARVFVPTNGCFGAALRVENLRLVVGSLENEGFAGVGWLMGDGPELAHLFSDKENIGEPTHEVTVLFEEDPLLGDIKCVTGSRFAWVPAKKDRFGRPLLILLANPCQPNQETTEALRQALDSPPK